MNETLSILGSGLIATGIAACASKTPGHKLWARSELSAARASREIARACERLGESHQPSNIEITTDIDELAGGTFFIEAVAEDLSLKCAVLCKVGSIARDTAVISTTTSSLDVSIIALASRRPEWFVGFHVFSPVTRMKLVELAFSPNSLEDVRNRSFKLCIDLGKSPVEVPPDPGFIVNRLLFPYLLHAATYMSTAGIPPQTIDECMTLGAGHPMGPIALLDYIGLDVAASIGDALGIEVPASIRDLVLEGHLGRKTGRGLMPEAFYSKD